MNAAECHGCCDDECALGLGARPHHGVLGCSQLGEHVTWFDTVASEQWRGIIRAGLDPAATLAHRITTESMVLSFNDGFRMTMTSIGLGIIMVLILKKAQAGGAPSGAH